MTHEIKPQQLRALLLLLVLVPLIPTGLMVRFMYDAVEAERAGARERLAATYQQALGGANAAFARRLAGRAEPVTPQEAHEFYREVLDPEVAVRISDATGLPLTGWEIPANPVLAQTSLQSFDLPWSVQLFLLEENTLDSLAREQWRIYGWTAGVAVIAIFGIAAAAAVTLHRQLTLRELKSTSVATVAHELRTPLASMRLLVDTLREGRCTSQEQLREYLDLIAGENLRLSRLTENFLTLSRLERRTHGFTLAAIDAADAARAAAKMLDPQLHAPGCEFTLAIDDALPPVQADRDAMITVLLNLLENALKYSGDQKRISLRVSAEKGAVHFAVEDNGPGLTAAERRHIFQPFYQADRKLSRVQGGCGLGLSIVSQIVEAHGGKLTVASEPGKGSTFTVALPALTA